MNKQTWAGLIIFAILALLLILAISHPPHADAATVLLWTMPVDRDPWLRVSLWATREGHPDTLWLGVLDSLRAGAPCSTWVNVGCIPWPERWTFGMHVLDYAGNASGPSNTVSSIFLP